MRSTIGRITHHKHHDSTKSRMISRTKAKPLLSCVRQLCQAIKAKHTIAINQKPKRNSIALSIVDDSLYNKCRRVSNCAHKKPAKVRLLDTLSRGVTGVALLLAAPTISRRSRYCFCTYAVTLADQLSRLHECRRVICSRPGATLAHGY